MHPALTFFEEQENVILQAAAKCIEAASLLDFTMASISQEAGLSMGSIYKHIQSKEDVLVALGYRSHLHFEALVRTVFALPLPVPACIVAVQLVDRRHLSPYRFGMQLVTLLGNPALLQRASPRWVEKYLARDVAIEDLFRHALLEAADTGELAVDANARDNMINEITTAIWSLCIGHQQVTRQRNARELVDDMPRPELDSTLVRALQRLLNTYPWREPLTDEVLHETCRVLARKGLR